MTSSNFRVYLNVSWSHAVEYPDEPDITIRHRSPSFGGRSRRQSDQRYVTYVPPPLHVLPLNSTCGVVRSPAFACVMVCSLHAHVCFVLWFLPPLDRVSVEDFSQVRGASHSARNDGYLASAH